MNRSQASWYSPWYIPTWYSKYSKDKLDWTRISMRLWHYNTQRYCGGHWFNEKELLGQLNEDAYWGSAEATRKAKE